MGFTRVYGVSAEFCHRARLTRLSIHPPLTFAGQQLHPLHSGPALPTAAGWLSLVPLARIEGIDRFGFVEEGARCFLEFETHTNP